MIRTPFGLPLAFFLVAPVAHAQAAPARMALGAGPTVALPQGDADDYSGTSLGARLVFVFWATPMIGVVGSFDYVFVNADEDVVGDADVGYYAVDVGARITTPRPAALKPFGELLVGRHTLSVDSGFADDSESELGLRLGGGGAYQLGARLVGTAQLSYSHAEIDNADVDALMLDFVLSGQF